MSSIEDARRKRAQGALPASRDARRAQDEVAPYAAPADVADVTTPLVDNDGNVFVGIRLPPRDCAGWMLTPEQGERLGELLIREARRARREDDAEDPPGEVDEAGETP